MRLVKVEEIHPSVRIANHHRVAAAQHWERSIPDLQMICVLSGIFEYREPDRAPLVLVGGDFLFIEPNTRHRFSLASTQDEGWIAGLHFEFVPSGRWAAGDYRLVIQPDRVTHLEESNYLQDRFQYLAAVYESYRPYRQELVDSIAAEILLLLAAHWQGQALWSAEPSQRMQAMLVYIREHLAQPLTRQSLAQTFNLSAGYVNQLFQSELGMTPSAVINRERLARAYQLMDREGLTVAESAFRVGFRDPFYFSRLFKQVYMVAPSDVAAHRHRKI